MQYVKKRLQNTVDSCDKTPLHIETNESNWTTGTVVDFRDFKEELKYRQLQVILKILLVPFKADVV